MGCGDVGRIFRCICRPARYCSKGVAKMDSYGTAKIFILANLVDVFCLRLAWRFALASCCDLALVEI